MRACGSRNIFVMSVVDKPAILPVYKCFIKYVVGKLVAYLTIKGILESLPHAKFLQVHKSHIVNLDFITTIEGNMLHVGNTKITVGQSYLSEVMGMVLKDRFVKR